MDRWVGKTAVVTGASAGIGAAIAVQLADAGLNVVGLARRPHLIEKLNEDVKAGKGKIYAKKCDVASREGIIQVFAAINEQFGGINILVNNAGCVKIGTFTDAGEAIVSDDDIEMVIKTNLLGLVTCSREGAKYMKQTGEQGHIVNISRANMYYGSKHAVQATSKAMRLEFSHSKADIKITCVSPYGVRTEMLRDVIERGAYRSTEVLEAKEPDTDILEASDVP